MHRRHSGNWARGHLTDEEPTPKYFVPTFSIRRNVSLDDRVTTNMQKRLRKALGPHYDILPPARMGLTIVEQRKFIERLREARIMPAAKEMTELALSTRDGLEEILKNKPSTLVVPVRDTVSVFGAKDNKLTIEPLGWKGYNARYASENEFGEPLPLASIVVENKFAIGSISAAMAHNRTFVVDGLARPPHITLAKKRGTITDRELRRVNNSVQDILPNELTLEDPVIYLRAERQGPVEPIYVRTSGPDGQSKLQKPA